MDGAHIGLSLKSVSFSREYGQESQGLRFERLSLDSKAEKWGNC